MAMTIIVCKSGNFGAVTPEFKRVVGLHPLIFIFKEINSLTQIISGSTWPIFTKFKPYGRNFVAVYGSDFLFPIAQGTLPWQPILTSILAKSAYSHLFVALAFENGLQYRTSDFEAFIYDYLVTSYKHFGDLRYCNSVVQEGERCTPLVDQQFGYVRFTARLCRDQ